MIFVANKHMNTQFVYFSSSFIKIKMCSAQHITIYIYIPKYLIIFILVNHIWKKLESRKGIDDCHLTEFLNHENNILTTKVQHLLFKQIHIQGMSYHLHHSLCYET